MVHKHKHLYVAWRWRRRRRFPLCEKRLLALNLNKLFFALKRPFCTPPAGVKGISNFRKLPLKTNNVLFLPRSFQRNVPLYLPPLLISAHSISTALYHRIRNELVHTHWFRRPYRYIPKRRVKMEKKVMTLRTAQERMGPICEGRLGIHGQRRRGKHGPTP